MRYEVRTRQMSEGDNVVSTVMLGGAVLMARQAGVGHLQGREVDVLQFMEEQNRAVIEDFVTAKTEEHARRSDFFAEAKKLLRGGRGRAALKVLQDGLKEYPADPFLLSYYGCLMAVVEKRHGEGVEICLQSIKRLKETVPFGAEAFYPHFYLNLGRACLAGGNKSDAVKAFTRGLKADPEDRDLQWEMKKLGARRKPPVPFLRRANPINKYIGLMLSRTAKR
jgi:predicted Zn-dependent protease